MSDVPTCAWSCGQRIAVPPVPRWSTITSRYEASTGASLEAIFATKPAAHWVDNLADAGAAVGPTHEIADLFTDRHVKARGSIVDMGSVKVVRTPIRLLDARGEEDAAVITPPPALGEHTDAALSAAGLGAAEIAALREAKVI